MLGRARFALAGAHAVDVGGVLDVALQVAAKVGGLALRGPVNAVGVDPAEVLRVVVVRTTTITSSPVRSDVPPSNRRARRHTASILS